MYIQIQPKVKQNDPWEFVASGTLMIEKAYNEQNLIWQIKMRMRVRIKLKAETIQQTVAVTNITA